MTSSFKQFWSTTKQFWSTAVAIAVFMGLIAVITIVLAALAANARPLPDADSTPLSEYSSIEHAASTAWIATVHDLAKAQGDRLPSDRASSGVEYYRAVPKHYSASIHLTSE